MSFPKWPVGDVRDVWERWHSQPELLVVFLCVQFWCSKLLWCPKLSGVSPSHPYKTFLSVHPSWFVFLTEAVYKGAGWGQEGREQGFTPLKLLHIFTPGCKAGEGLVWWSSQESQSNSGFGHHQSAFPCGKTLVHTAGKQEPGLVGRRSRCAAFQGLQSFRGLPSTCYTPGSGWLLCPAWDPLKWHCSATAEWSCGCQGR